MVARSVLESAGISCLLRGEHAAWVGGANSTFKSPEAFGGLPLQVMPQDEAQARQLLSQPLDASFETDTGEFVQPVCPQCGSKDIATYSGAVHGKRLEDAEDAWQCRKCKCVWEDDGAGTTSREPLR